MFRGRGLFRLAVPDGVELAFGQSYCKGALVLHMPRTMLFNLTKSQDLFFRILRDFATTYSGREAATEDFVATVTRNAPGDWRWFFEQWIDGTEVPTYFWSWQAARQAGGDGKFAVELEVEQSGVPTTFRMPVPVRFDFEGGGSGVAVVLVDQPRESFHLTLPKRPREVVFNAGQAVLARVRER